MSYHSLEDRIVKQAFASRARSSAPVDLPVVPAGSGPTLRLLTRGAELPTEAEVSANPRAASVKLRAAERVDPDAPAVKAMYQPRSARPTKSTAPARGRRRGVQGDAATSKEGDSR
jgi:16S rRNA (cytosine1402-N4)-methyltransferase